VLVEIDVLRALHVNGQDDARCTITDTGIGIPQEKQSLLFQQFTQADTSTTREFGGTGLGLAISRRLVELMGGKVGFSSEAGVGSKFWFTLPAPMGAEAAPPPPHEPSAPEMADMRVLIVDDLSVNRMLLCRQLAAWGITHEAVESGERALDALKRAQTEGKPFEVALLDFLMPEMDGFELGQRIKSDPLLARTSLVMLTSGSQRSAADAFLLAGFSVFLCKPVVRPSELFDALIEAWNAHPDHVRADVPVPVAKAVASKSEAPAETAGAVLLAKPATRFKVLVAEDNTINQRLVKRMLENLGA
jgi:CheY-like chemotaxis protein